jgi:hypothetical protein
MPRKHCLKKERENSGKSAAQERSQFYLKKFDNFLQALGAKGQETDPFLFDSSYQKSAILHCLESGSADPHVFGPPGSGSISQRYCTDPEPSL